MIKKLTTTIWPGPLELKNAARKGTNLARKGKYSSTITGRLRAQAQASSNHYSLVRPFWRKVFITKYGSRPAVSG